MELMVRWFDPQAVGAPGVQELRRGRFSEPGKHEIRTAEFHVQVHVNTAGFVDREWGPRRPGVSRVLLVGDSFVQAAQVPLEQGLGRVLSTELTDLRGAEVEVLSMGVPGAGTATSLDLVRTEGIGLKPDVVVLGFLVSNDIMNNHPLLEGKTDKPFYMLQDGALVPTDREVHLSQGAGSVPLWALSHTLRWGVRRWLSSKEAQRQIDAGDGVPIPLRVHDPQPGPHWEESWQVTAAMVDALGKYCESRGIRLGILLIPDDAQSSTAGRDRMTARWPESAQWDLDAATRRAEGLAAQHAAVLDLQPALSGAGRGLYFVQDGHWTARGHGAAARAAAPWVSELLD